MQRVKITVFRYIVLSFIKVSMESMTNVLGIHRTVDHQNFHVYLI